ncbi:pyridoxamine 5'-phosphate oxidase family protein [Paraburkholderia bonniea]|uniref:HugZ family pyridoxamine 5'-phosphate oxidase n=1 Tax=Paraburkholderia bonniea TaxID=2152891 RepID=UPI001291D9E3|nr:pyridoxamine 5'-phosphate oxidase family protein [Paraburkholderia bonniea]WJF90197.1 pyridoxamine 5'-phosphate oxidase family protein [Paraburkholderia bonniea]WJF93511.1 pyridoxamine 5'-phosphate oxidase family protein [Paraburkholderia bonniea]
MHIPAHSPLHLLHQTVTGTLATHSRQPAGFPYPSVMPFALDQHHRPTILVSKLAEHTRNLLADPRAGFLVAHAPDGDVLDAERVTLLGTFEAQETSPELAQRYLRYHPKAQRFLDLGDFTFWSLAIERMRYIGGFGTMGWLKGEELDPLEPLGFDEETALLAFFAAHPARKDTLHLLGVDRYGADLVSGNSRTRVIFDSPKLDSAALHNALVSHLEAQAN